MKAASVTITLLSSNGCEMDDGFFEKSYKKYCDFKHLNFVSPGTLTENIDEFTIDWFADLMTLIVGYLQKYKLNACII